MRSNFLKIYFPDTVRYNGGACKRILISIASCQHFYWHKGCTPKVEKMKKNEKTEKNWSYFLRRVSSKIVFKWFFHSCRGIQWFVEQDGFIPTRRVIRCQKNFEKPGRRHIDEAKDLKSKFEGCSYVKFRYNFIFGDSSFQNICHPEEFLCLYVLSKIKIDTKIVTWRPKK